MLMYLELIIGTYHIGIWISHCPVQGVVLHPKQAVGCEGRFNVDLRRAEWETERWPQQEGLCCISPRGTAGSPLTCSSSIKCLADLMYLHLCGLFSPAVLEGEKVEAGWVFAVDLC